MCWGNVVGQAPRLLLLQPVLLVLCRVIGAAAMATFVYCYEQLRLSARFGAEDDAYRRAVPAWTPRLRPWQPDPADHPPPALLDRLAALGGIYWP